MSNPAMAKLVRKIRRSIAKREAYIMPEKEWLTVSFFQSTENPADIICRIASFARCDWLYEYKTGEARFFEFA